MTTTANTQTKTDNATAARLAKEYNEEHFPMRGGTIDLDSGAIAIFDNHPMVGELMDARIPLMEAVVTAAGGTTIAVASYPESGPDAGYTVVVLAKGADGDELFRRYRDDVRGRPAPDEGASDA